MFKSATLYQCTIPIPDLLERLTPALAGRPFKPCPKKQAASSGFIPPLGGSAEEQEITYATNGGVLMCLRTDVKEVAASAVREEVEARRAKALADGGEFNKTDERLAKEEITEGYLPGIPPKSKLTYAYLDKERALFFVGATDAGADHFTEILGKALGGAPPLTLLSIEDDPCDKFTAWVKDGSLLGKAFKLGHQGALKNPGHEGGCGNINAKNEDFDSEEFLSLIEAGREVCSIALKHEDMTFRLTSKLGIRNIALSDERKAEAYDEEEDGITTAYEFAVFVLAMRTVLDDLAPLLGGWPKQEMLDLHDREES